MIALDLNNDNNPDFNLDYFDINNNDLYQSAIYSDEYKPSFDSKENENIYYKIKLNSQLNNKKDIWYLSVFELLKMPKNREISKIISKSNQIIRFCEKNNDNKFKYTFSYDINNDLSYFNEIVNDFFDTKALLNIYRLKNGDKSKIPSKITININETLIDGEKIKYISWWKFE